MLKIIKKYIRKSKEWVNLDKEEKKNTNEEINKKDNEFEKKDIRVAILDHLEESSTKGRNIEKIEKLDDIELPVRVEFARVKKTIEEILAIYEGEIVKLNRFAGEQVDIYVSERLFAKGEITVVDDKFGVRIVEIMPHEEKID